MICGATARLSPAASTIDPWEGANRRNDMQSVDCGWCSRQIVASGYSALTVWRRRRRCGDATTTEKPSATHADSTTNYTGYDLLQL